MSGNHAIVYNLQPENRFEVALLHSMETFSDPVRFSITGFQINTKAKTMVVNNRRTMGIGTKL